MKTKEKVQLLKNQGKGLLEICSLLQLSKSTVYYHYSSSSKERVLSYQKERRLAKKEGKSYSRKATHRNKSSLSPIIRVRFYKFKNGIHRRNLKFGQKKSKITEQQLITKFNDYPYCYLTGRKLTLDQQDLAFDHINPVANEGSNEIDNLGFTTFKLNLMKNSIPLDEFIELCKLVANNFK